MTRSGAPTFWRSAWGFALIVALVGFALAGVRWLLVTHFLAQAEFSADALASRITASMASGEPLDDSIFRNYIAKEPNTGYLVVANYRSGYRSGVINPASLDLGAGEIRDFLKENGTDETLARLMRPDSGFKGEYLRVLSFTFTPPKEAAERTPIGTLKVATLLPGFPYGRGYFKAWWAANGILFCLFVLGVVLGFVRRRQEDRETAQALVKANRAEEDDQGLLEGEDTLEWDDDDPWKPLFNGVTLAGLQTKGTWYGRNEELWGEPWGASVVSERFQGVGSYQFRFYAQKTSGVDGFVVLFVCGEHALAWVVGGWFNKRSEVGGYEKTRVDLIVESHRWYKLEVKVGKEELEGSINDQVVWRMARSDVTGPSPDAGFLKGVGVGVWSTQAKFKDLRAMAL